MNSQDTDAGPRHDKPFVLDGSMSVAGGRALLGTARRTWYVVLRRLGQPVEHVVLHYSEFEDVLREVPQEAVLETAVKDRPVSPQTVMGTAAASTISPTQRQVIIDDGWIVGVLPSGEDVDLQPVPGMTTLRRGGPKPERGRTSGRRSGSGVLRRGKEPVSQNIEQYVRTSSPGAVTVGSEFDLLVTLSGSPLKPDAGAGASDVADVANVDEGEGLEISVYGLGGVEVQGDRRWRLAPVRPHDQTSRTFRVRADEAGLAYVLIDVRQGSEDVAAMKVVIEVSENVSECAPAVSITDAEVQLVNRPRSRHRMMVLESAHYVQFELDLQLPTGRVLLEARHSIERSEVRDLVSTAYRELEQTWAATSGQADMFERTLAGRGRMLFERLVPSDIRAALWNHRTDIDSIEVISTEPLIPWEIVHLAPPDSSADQGGGDECFLGQFGLFRTLHGSRPAKTLSLDRVRAVVPTYTNNENLDGLGATTNERTFLAESLRAQIIPATSGEVLCALTDTDRYDVFHFAGHGCATLDDIDTSALLLDDFTDHGGDLSGIIRPSLVRSLDFASATRAPLVVLNACQLGRLGYVGGSLSGFAEAFMRAGAGAFVGAMWSVEDQPAHAFIIEFYRQLLAHQRLADALVAARAAARQHGSATWLAYTVYGDPDARVAS